MLNPTFHIQINIRSWRTTDEYGTEWWYSHEVTSTGSQMGPTFQSRVSRMRAESYVLAERAGELQDMHKTFEEGEGTCT